MKSKGLFVIFLSFAMGMGGNLHLLLPGIGYIAMLDLVAYVVAIPILFLKWNRMGKHMRQALKFSFAWTFASMLANSFNFVEMHYWLKCVSLASSSWAIITCAYVVLKNCPTGYIWYLIGAGLSGWISLYYFRNGSLEGYATRGGQEVVGSSLEFLMDKQIYPSIATGIFMGLFLFFLHKFRKIPILFVISGALLGGVWLLLHGGSRSSFGQWCAAAAIGFMVAYCERIYRQLGRHPILMAALAISGVLALFGAYAMMAKSGVMEAGEEAKLENEFGEGGGGAIKGRAGFHLAIRDAMDSWLIGKGWHLRNHSVLANSLACEGVVGFLFWAYFCAQVLWFVCKRMPYSGRYSVFISLMILMAVWDVVGSPFGTRHKFFVLMAFIAICRDDPFYSVGCIFNQKDVLYVPFEQRRFF